MVISIMKIIERHELRDVLDAKWLLVYGRRKTGKTFYIRERAKYSHYFIVTSGREIFEIKRGEIYSFSEFMRVFPLLLKQGKVVIDEFHRLGEPFFSAIQGLSGMGELILITSTRHYFKRFIGSNSPLLGLFYLRELGLVDPQDAINFVEGLGHSGKTLIELAVLVQEPWLAPAIENLGERVFSTFGATLKGNVPSLIGEIFTEEERELTMRYSAILEAVADGKSSSGEIANELYSRGLIEKETHSAVAPYLETLVNMGILERIPIFGKRKKIFKYRHLSPVVDFAYYLNAKYGFFETEVPDEVVERILRERMPHYVERFFERLLAKQYSLQPVRIEMPDLEVDIALLRNKKLYLVAEAKWKEKIKEKDIRKVEEKFEGLNAKKKLLIVPDKKVLPRAPENAEVLDCRDVTKPCKAQP
ncbi:MULTISPECIES: ATPase [Thermococcus]|uniref:Archaeal ATPase n=1 Tax=Thermococcus sibiricus (strain DSM 12597 / MM 739) TaxID=604354 RepID=C6A131_THESM|nr:MULTISPECIES: ATPase [Thermococcus]ACS89326.1 Archaeal ATPase [Thermococcus sibiricus MM 739]